jgi:hypothetical protein
MARAAFVRLAHAALLLATTLAAAPALEAQGTIFVPAGQRVRVASPVYTGSGYAAWATDDTLTMIVSRQPAPLALPLASITSLQARRTNSRFQGALRKLPWGTLAGVAAFGLSNLFVDYDEQYPNREGYTSLSRTGAILLYVGGGSALGAAWGAYRPGGRWERAGTPVRVRVTPADQ